MASSRSPVPFSQRKTGFLLKDPESGSYFRASFGDDSREWDPDPWMAWNFSTFESALGGQVTWFIVKDKMLNVVPYQQALTEWEEQKERDIEEQVKRLNAVRRATSDLVQGLKERRSETANDQKPQDLQGEQPTTSSLNTFGVDQTE